MTAPLSDAPARERIATALDTTLFVQAGAGSGKTKSLVDRVVALIDDGIEMRSIATITFTEKAAAELRDRIRRELEKRRSSTRDAAVGERYRIAVDQIDAAAISTLHAFAQRILTEHAIEAGLPPNVEVLDEVASQIEFEDRWTRFRDRLLEDPALERTLLLAFATGIRVDDIRSLAALFQDNWDLVEDEARVPWGEQEPPKIDTGDLVTEIEALLARRGECTAADDKLLSYLTEEIEPFVRRLAAAPDEYEILRLLREDKPSFRCSHGKAGSWVDKPGVVEGIGAAGQARSELADAVAQACVHRIAVEVRRFTLEAAAVRRTSGRLEFHDLLVLARAVLRGPNGPQVRERLRNRYRRLLLDEFQDTDPIQIDLAVLIASATRSAGDRWHEVDTEPGRLFFVGDPKQSIYRFRRADIQLFLAAGEVFGTPAVSLTTNFRTTPPIIEWVNHVFGRLIQYEESSQPAYEPLDASPWRTAPPDGQAVVLLGAEEHPADTKADLLREREATDVAQAVRTALGWQVSVQQDDGRETWRPATLGDITILLPARTSLAALEKALDDEGIAYRAETSSLVYSTREVRELMAAARALADPTDQLALVTALRSPLFGCGDDDLFTYGVQHGGAWSFLVPPPEDVPADHPVADALRYLRQLHQQVPWLTPSETLQRLAADRRLFELGYGQGRPRDLWRRLRFVIDQARAWSESEGGTLRHYLDWARLQASESARVAETVLPETDDDSVRILTIHGSKGLEFPITIVSGLTSQSTGRANRVEVRFPAEGPAAIKVGSKLVTPEYENFKPIDEQMGYHERLRLLYVACTRAKDHLVVSLHRKKRKPPDEDRKYTNAELLHRVSDDAPHQQVLQPGPGPSGADVTAPAAAPLPAYARWREELEAALAGSARRRSIGASDLEIPEPEPEAELDDGAAAGAKKGPRDLELPAWQKGRYGTAIGRAVHAVLQTVDLRTGAGLEETAAAQAAAEGVLGREADIVRLARTALDAPAVRESLDRPRWRETYVATPLGDRTLEGYVDLLYRTDDGLVVVDYKTASSSHDLERRVAGYRAQGGAYAFAVEQAAGEPVVRVVFVFLTPDGVVERDLPDLDDAKAAVREAVVALA